MCPRQGRRLGGKMQERVREFQNQGREGHQGTISALARLWALSTLALTDVFRAVPKRIPEGDFLAALGQPLSLSILQTWFLELCLQSVLERVPRRNNFQEGWPLCTPAMFNLLNISFCCVW